MKYLLFIAKNYSMPIFQPIVSYLDECGIDYRFYLSQKVLSAFPQFWKKELILSGLKESKDYNPDFVLCPGNTVDFRIPGKKVQIFHGLGIEKASHFQIRHFFDIYCTSGPFVTERFMQAKKRHKYLSIIETGWPKIDHILRYNAEDLRQKLKIPHDKKAILYAPTFSEKMQSATDLMTEIPSIRREDEIWIVKFHELMNKEIVHNFKQEMGDNAIFVEHYDITPYLHAGDVLISDTSSVIYEFMVLNKPIITYNTISREDKALNITSKSDLRNAIDQCLGGGFDFGKRYEKQLAEINPYLDGNISKNLIDTLNNLGNDYPPYRKPLNLFRKIKYLLFTTKKYS